MNERFSRISSFIYSIAIFLIRNISASRLPIVPATPALVIPAFLRVFHIIDALSDNAIAKPKYMMYGLQFDSINYGNNKTNIGGSMQCKFLSDFGLIVGSSNYYEVILDKFFNDNLKNNICYKDNIMIRFI